MRIKYETWNPGPDALDVIRNANRICADLQARGYDLTLRQLYYQFVARGLIPNTQQSYKRLGDVVNKARMAGLMDWDYIVDRTRNLQSISHWNDPAAIVRSAARSFAIDKWGEYEGSTFHTTNGAIYRAMDARCGGRPFLEVRRIALNWDQVQEYAPPPNPAKLTDSRSGRYCEEFGDESWELDALDPDVLDQLIEDEVLAVRDESTWLADEEAEERHRTLLTAASDRWTEVVTFLSEEEAS